MATDSNGFIYEHDKRPLLNSPGLGSRKPFCRTGPLEIGSGDKVAQINQILSDEETTNLPAITLSFTGRFNPLGAETDFGSFNFNASGYTDARFSARQVQMKIEGDVTQDFQVGKIRLDVKARGRR